MRYLDLYYFESFKKDNGQYTPSSPTDSKAIWGIMKGKVFEGESSELDSSSHHLQAVLP